MIDFFFILFCNINLFRVRIFGLVDHVTGIIEIIDIM